MNKFAFYSVNKVILAISTNLLDAATQIALLTRYLKSNTMESKSVDESKNNQKADYSEEEYDYAAADGLPEEVVKGGKHKGKCKSQNHPHSSRGVNL